MLEKYSIKLLLVNASPLPLLSSLLIPPDFQLNSQNSITLPSLRSIPEKATIQLKESERGSKQDLRRRLCTPFPFTVTDMSGALRRSV